MRVVVVHELRVHAELVEEGHDGELQRGDAVRRDREEGARAPVCGRCWAVGVSLGKGGGTCSLNARVSLGLRSSSDSRCAWVPERKGRGRGRGRGRDGGGLRIVASTQPGGRAQQRRSAPESKNASTFPSLASRRPSKKPHSTSMQCCKHCTSASGALGRTGPGCALWRASAWAHLLMKGDSTCAVVTGFYRARVIAVAAGVEP